ncbi:MAG TPA: RNA methyltransferase [Acidobacteriaceae bacterium]|nr:RNA methyltransferase [Acidobacteriaceae bacterium]
MRTAAVSSRTNPHLKQLRGAFAGNARLSGGLVAIEGENLLFEAVRSGVRLDRIFLADDRSAPDWLPSGVDIIEVDREALRSAVDAVSPQGIAALVVAPEWSLADACRPETSPLVLIAAGLQDPGNLGTLVRSAEAFGAECLLTTSGTVSAWNPKTVRASAGSVFRVPVVRVSADELSELNRKGLQLIAAVAEDSREGPPPVGAVDADLTGACALMIGNEGSGLTGEWLRLATARITIPMPGPVESLNAAIAGSLLLYEAARQRARHAP